ncbi:hypothetical protein L6452_18689 [Arctium lappa]|uniref:Uncharacterized protein n=1 Tax=Arctium lappa TaxID=4217 RepID=A0ACB9C6Y4_ARCLA|nr:hypothetical protein L6452_18689 [Arctium lappa]
MTCGVESMSDKEKLDIGDWFQPKNLGHLLPGAMDGMIAEEGAARRMLTSVRFNVIPLCGLTGVGLNKVLGGSTCSSLGPAESNRACNPRTCFVYAKEQVNFPRSKGYTVDVLGSIVKVRSRLGYPGGVLRSMACVENVKDDEFLLVEDEGFAWVEDEEFLLGCCALVFLRLQRSNIVRSDLASSNPS